MQSHVHPCNLTWVRALQLLGPDLDIMVARGQIGAHNFLPFASRMLTAVESFHAGGFVHRDIKPGETSFRLSLSLTTPYAPV